MKDDDMLNPVQGDGRFAGSLPFFGGEKIWEANPQIVDKLREVGALLHAEKITHSYMHCWRHKTPIIYRATTQWFAGMDDVPGWNGVKPPVTLRQLALAGIEATEFFPAWGKARLYGMIANRPDWTLVETTAMGRADAVLRAQGNGRTASAHDGIAGGGRAASGEGRHRGVANARPERAGWARRRSIRQDQGHARRVVRLGCDASDRAWRSGRLPDARRLSSGHRPHFPPISISRAPTSIADGFTHRC
jgi:hypothetical protein